MSRRSGPKGHKVSPQGQDHKARHKVQCLSIEHQSIKTKLVYLRVDVIPCMYFREKDVSIEIVIV